MFLKVFLILLFLTDYLHPDYSAKSPTSTSKDTLELISEINNSAAILSSAAMLKEAKKGAKKGNPQGIEYLDNPINVFLSLSKAKYITTLLI